METLAGLRSAPQNQKADLLKKAFLWLSFVILPELPAILIDHTTSLSRLLWSMMWLLNVGLFFFALLLVNKRVKKQGDPRPSAVPWHPITFVWIGFFAFILLISIWILNTDTAFATSAMVGDKLSEFVAPIFPWVDRFHKNLAIFPSGSELQQDKVLAVVSLWFLFAVLSAGLAFVRLDRRSIEERQRANENIAKQKSNTAQTFTTRLKVAVYFTASIVVFFGWPDFSIKLQGKACVFAVPCYMNDDLGILIAAFLKAFIVFMGGLAPLLIWVTNRNQFTR